MLCASAACFAPVVNVPQNVQCPICTPVKEYVRRTRTQAGGAGGMPGAAQPTGSMSSNPLAAGSELQQSQQTQQAMAMQQQMQAQQQQQAVSSQMLGQKRPLNGMDPAAAAAMPAGSLPPGMMPVGPSSTGGMMGMVPQAMPQQQQYQQGAGSYGAMPGGGGMQGMSQGMMPMANGGMDEQHIKRVKQEGSNQQLLAKVGMHQMQRHCGCLQVLAG
jgi:E1A/CREB-binding protein